MALEMKAYRTELTLDEPRRIVLEGVPFQQGQCVEILVIPRTSGEPDAVTRLKDLFRETQSLPQLQTLTEQDVAAEVEAYRNGR